MNIEEETDEYLFVQHTTAIMDVPNSRPDLDPGGLWVKGCIRLSWGLRLSTEPPTLQIGRSSAALNGNAASLPYALHARLHMWRAVWAARTESTYTDLKDLNFREIVIITAILGWEKGEVNDR
jgi:hypothetical protein